MSQMKDDPTGDVCNSEEKRVLRNFELSVTIGELVRHVVERSA